MLGVRPVIATTVRVAFRDGTACRRQRLRQHQANGTTLFKLAQLAFHLLLALFLGLSDDKESPDLPQGPALPRCCQAINQVATQGATVPVDQFTKRILTPPPMLRCPHDDALGLLLAWGQYLAMEIVGVQVV
mmetsp:Transcript_1408/g.2769  ORF Transcript_1408/g.2769 Transcript_1408/m.2769 type:complete len:132 (+) Transcript_1408:1760-2155(+)